MIYPVMPTRITDQIINACISIIKKYCGLKNKLKPPLFRGLLMGCDWKEGICDRKGKKHSPGRKFGLLNHSAIVHPVMLRHPITPLSHPSTAHRAQALRGGCPAGGG